MDRPQRDRLDRIARICKAPVINEQGATEKLEEIADVLMEETLEPAPAQPELGGNDTREKTHNRGDPDVE